MCVAGPHAHASSGTRRNQATAIQPAATRARTGALCSAVGDARSILLTRLLREVRGGCVVIGHHGGPDSKTYQAATEAGFEVLSVADATKEADIVMVLVPDTIQGKLYEADIAPNLEAGNSLMFAHGFAVHYGEVTPPAHVDVALVAPKGPGGLVRRQFEEDKGVPCLLAVH